MIKVTKLAHVGLNAVDLSPQAEFYNDRWGLERIDEYGGEMFFRAEGPAHHVLTLHEQQRLVCTTCARSRPARTRSSAPSKNSGCRHGGRDSTTRELEPGMQRIRFKDPDGFLVEFVAGSTASDDPFGTRDVKPQDLNHVVLNVADVERSEHFIATAWVQADGPLYWRPEFLGMQRQPPLARIRPGADGNPAFHHAAFDMKDWEDWLKAIFYAGERGIRRVWGPGRHLFGNNLFSYYKDPEGNTVEYTAK